MDVIGVGLDVFDGVFEVFEGIVEVFNVLVEVFNDVVRVFVVVGIEIVLELLCVFCFGGVGGTIFFFLFLFVWDFLRWVLISVDICLILFLRFLYLIVIFKLVL